MSELEPYRPSFPDHRPGLDRRARRIDREAALHARLVAHREEIECIRREVRLRKGAEMARDAVENFRVLDSVIAEDTRDNPGLELGCRRLEQRFQTAVADVVAQYVRGS